jgi:hypothetical protein
VGSVVGGVTGGVAGGVGELLGVREQESRPYAAAAPNRRHYSNRRHQHES